MTYKQPLPTDFLIVQKKNIGIEVLHKGGRIYACQIKHFSSQYHTVCRKRNILKVMFYFSQMRERGGINR